MEHHSPDLNIFSPESPLEMQKYDSLSSFDEYCRYGMDFIDDKVRYHPFWLSRETEHNCYEGNDNFRSKLKEINRLGLYTHISQPSEISDTFIQYPFVGGVMDKQKAKILMDMIDNLKSDNLIYVVDNKTNYDHQKHSNLLVHNESIKVSYNPKDDINVRGTWFSLTNNFNGLINNLMPNLDSDNYCLVNFMDNRTNDDLFDVIIELLKTC